MTRNSLKLFLECNNKDDGTVLQSMLNRFVVLKHDQIFHTAIGFYEISSLYQPDLFLHKH